MSAWAMALLVYADAAGMAQVGESGWAGVHSQQKFLNMWTVILSKVVSASGCKNKDQSKITI